MSYDAQSNYCYQIPSTAQEHKSIKQVIKKMIFEAKVERNCWKSLIMWN